MIHNCSMSGYHLFRYLKVLSRLRFEMYLIGCLSSQNTVCLVQCNQAFTQTQL